MSESIIKRYTLEDLRGMKSETDWDRLRREGDYEGEAEFEVDWSTARIEGPVHKEPISLRIDPDVLAFFRAQGKGYQTRMNAVLRAYMEAVTKGTD